MRDKKTRSKKIENRLWVWKQEKKNTETRGHGVKRWKIGMGMEAGKERHGDKGTGHRTYAKCGAVMVHQRERLWLLRAGINRNGDKDG